MRTFGLVPIHMDRRHFCWLPPDRLIIFWLSDVDLTLKRWICSRAKVSIDLPSIMPALQNRSRDGAMRLDVIEKLRYRPRVFRSSVM